MSFSDIVKGNLKVVLALCHSLQRHFGSSAGTNNNYSIMKTTQRQYSSKELCMV